MKRLAPVGMLAVSVTALAGPPFMTDDPVPVDYRHAEAYVFTTYDKGPDGAKTAQLPAFEVNASPLQDVQLHLMVPFANLYPAGGENQHGLGDVEVGVKYRFMHETDTLPQIAIFPMLELPTGDAAMGLGNGRAWWTFPVWIQKSWRDWTTYGGGGRAFNGAPGMRDYDFGGWLLQRQVSGHLTLGGEIFYQGAATSDGQHTTFFNAGGYYEGIRMCGGCSVLFRVGHSIAGETHTVGYFGLYWTWGDDTETNHPAMSGLESSLQGNALR